MPRRGRAAYRKAIGRHVQRRVAAGVGESREPTTALRAGATGAPRPSLHITEVLYSTGIRRSEVVRLHLYDLDIDRGTLTVRQGKGKKDRVVPIGERAIAWSRRYVADVRPAIVSPPDEAVLFLNGFGYPFSPDVLGHIVRDYVAAANIGKQGACHLFRHTMATLMLEGGADLRFIQAMLGHAHIQTTTIYTQVAIRALKEIHTATHPSAKLERRPPREEKSDDSEK